MLKATAPAFINKVKAGASEQALQAIFMDEQKTQIVNGELNLLQKNFP